MNDDYSSSLLYNLETLNSFDYNSILNCYRNSQSELYRFRAYIYESNLTHIQNYLILNISFYSGLIKTTYHLSIYSQTQAALEKSQNIYEHIEYLFCYIHNHSKTTIIKLLDTIDNLLNNLFKIISVTYNTLFCLRQTALNDPENKSSMYIRYIYDIISIGDPKLDYKYGVSCIRSSLNQIHNSLQIKDRPRLYSALKDLYSYDIYLHTILINSNFLQIATPYEISFALKDLILLNSNIINLTPINITYGSIILSTDKSIISLLKDFYNNSKISLDAGSINMLNELCASNHFHCPEISASNNNLVFDKISQLNNKIKSIKLEKNELDPIYKALSMNNSFTVLKSLLKTETKSMHYILFKIAYQNLYNLRCRIPLERNDFELYINKWLKF